MTRINVDRVPSFTRIRKICCVGAGYVGGPTSAMIAYHCKDVEVTVVDQCAERIAAWNSPNLPIDEPGLSDLVFAARDGTEHSPLPNLRFSTDVVQGIVEADMIFIAVNTPTKTIGHGAGFSLDIGSVEAVARLIGSVSYSSKIVVEKSTVPCRTAQALRDVLETNSRPEVQFKILSNPEFLAEGTAIHNLTYPDRILIGSALEDLDAAHLLRDIYAHWIPQARIITTNLWSSELAKLAANALLAQRISSINALSAICEKTGAAVDEIAYVAGLDHRIGPHMLKSSAGFGGSCFKKDVLELVYLAESFGLSEVARYWQGVIEINEWQKARFSQRILKCLNNTLTGKRIAVLGFAYKKNTSDTRESAAITIVETMIKEGAFVAVCDPMVSAARVEEDLFGVMHNRTTIQQHLTVVKTPYEACAGAHAVVVLTDGNLSVQESATLKDATHHTVDTSEAPVSTVHEHTKPPTHDQSSENITHATKVDGEGRPRPAGDKSLDWSRIAQSMKKPSHVFDGANAIDPKRLRSLGFRVEKLGQPSPNMYPDL